MLYIQILEQYFRLHCIVSAFVIVSFETNIFICSGIGMAKWLSVNVCVTANRKWYIPQIIDTLSLEWP